VLVLQPMSADLYVTLTALFRLGLVAMLLDPAAGREHIARCCAALPPKAFIGSAQAHLLRFTSSAIRRIPSRYSTRRWVPGAAPLEPARMLHPLESIVAVDGDAPALVTFTSGGTGTPKAAVRTHRFLLAQHRVLERSVQLVPGEIDLVTLPVFVLANLASGVTSVIADGDLAYPGRVDPAALLEQMDRTQPIRTAASPALLERLARYCRQHHRTMPGFRRILTGGAPVFPRVLDLLNDLAPQAELASVYGSTEAEPIAHLLRDEISASDRRRMIQGGGLLAGRPVREIELRVLRDSWGAPVGPFTSSAFAESCMPAGSAGEIVVSGEHVLGGYLHGRGDEDTKFDVDRCRWHRTGDAGYLDEKGRLWLLGRCSARISDARGAIYPFAVEGAASHHPGVARSALVPLDGKRMLLVEREAGSHDDLIAALGRMLAWAQLDRIRQIHHIPVDKRHNAKVDYVALQQLIRRMS